MPRPRRRPAYRRHAGRARFDAENWGWTAVWVGAAAFGIVPLAAGALGVAVVYWVIAVLALLFVWLTVPEQKRGRHRGGKGP